MNIDSTYIKTRTKKIDGKAIKVDTYKLTPFSILLIGGTGTGKSSLLASMFEEMGKNHPDLAFKPDKAADNGATFQNLNFQLKKLYQIVETHELEEYFAIPGGIQGKLAPFFRHLGSQFKPPHLCTSGVYNFYIILYPLMSIHFWRDFEA